MEWQNELKKSIITVEDLSKKIKLSSDEMKAIDTVIHHHPMSITRYYFNLINWEDPEDPIRKMIVPSIKELNLTGGMYDTSGEAENTKLVGLQHKYSSTALILATHQCTTYCRFCFRKRFVGISADEIIPEFKKMSDYIKGHKEIRNVLITGGDPFILDTKIIEKILNILVNINHLKYIRFGTKIPVVLPKRIFKDKDFLDILKKYSNKKTIYVVTHFNHPREITRDSKRAIDSLRESNVLSSNQTVLLRGVNDNPETLIDLMNNLVAIQVRPYYLFQMRPVARVKDIFQVPLYRGCKIVSATKGYLDGHAKTFRYVMSHLTGKIEILGLNGDHFIFKYHEAKNLADNGRIFTKGIDTRVCWLDDFPEV